MGFAPEGKWACTACTYHNPEGNAICEICQTPKPEPQKPGEPEPSAPQKPASPRPSAPQKPASPKAQNSTDLPPYYPPGWEERIDASSGRKYYVNLKTNSISWKNPNLEPAEKKPASIKKPVSKPSSSAWLSKIGSYDDDDDDRRQTLKRYNSGGSIGSFRR